MLPIHEALDTNSGEGSISTPFSKTLLQRRTLLSVCEDEQGKPGQLSLTCVLPEGGASVHNLVSIPSGWTDRITNLPNKKTSESKSLPSVSQRDPWALRRPAVGIAPGDATWAHLGMLAEE